MSIRIQNDGIAGAGASQISPTDSVTINGASRGASSTGGLTDRVEISSLSETLSSAMSGMDAQRAARIGRLTALYAQGQYQTDPAAIGRSLVSSALATGGVESER